MTTIQELDGLFDDHPSLSASLQDFEHASSDANASPKFGYPSQHSGFRSDSDSDIAETESGGGYSPPAWRRELDGRRSSGFWNSGSKAMGKRRMASREPSPESDYESAEDKMLEKAARTRLPTGSVSPQKQRSPSPDPYPGGGDFGKTFGGEVKREESEEKDVVPAAETANNYIRFAMRAEVQHRTEPYEAAFFILRDKFRAATKSWSSLLISLTIAIFSIIGLRTLFQPGNPPPVPDLVKVAGLAKSFEPLIFYSENGAQQVGDLQATGVAVWDLGESVRSTNMTSAPIIVKELDELSDTLKTLAIELTRFFSNVDGDVDGILIVIDWARRELTALHSQPPTPLSTLYTNTHSILSTLGLLESPPGSGTPTRLGQLTTTLFGPTTPQRTQATLIRTFHEFLTVLEDAINSELSHALKLFAIFSSIDAQFANLARTVVRESSAQDNAQDEMLSSLWTRIMGANAVQLSKFEKNKKLLGSIRRRTVANKGILREHERKLLSLKAGLEGLRRRLVGPLLRGNNGSNAGLEEQIRGLEEVGGYLGGVRERQKGRLLELLYGGGGHRARIVGEGVGEIGVEGS